MVETSPEERLKSLKKERSFIPLFPVYIKHDILESMLPYSNWIGFNYFELRRRKFYDDVKRRGIRKTFNIDDKKKIFLTSTNNDKAIEKFYDHEGIVTFKSDVKAFDATMVMGPDWYIYEDMNPSQRNESIEKAIRLNQECIDLGNIVPNIHGTNPQEIGRFVEPFKAQGINAFVMPGREYLINRYYRKRDQAKFSALTSTISRLEKIDLIVTGCSSPKLMFDLPDVSSFVSLGWLVQARCRRLIMGKTYMRILDPRFHCEDSRCCATFTKEELVKQENESFRAIHNLNKINSQVNERSKIIQNSLVS